MGPRNERDARVNDETKQRVVELIREKGYERRDDAFRLTSGEMSHDYVDGKRAIADGPDLRLVAQAMLDLCEANGVEFDAAGGLTLGADPIAHAIAIVGEKKWFTVRKETKGHGTKNRVEGARLGKGDRVLLVDDVVTTGGSIVQALQPIAETGAEIVFATAIMDRGKSASDRLGEHGIKFVPVCTYEDLGIDPVGSS